MRVSARRGAGALSRRRSRGCVNRPTALQVAERALELAASDGDGFQVSVAHERSLLSRFARSAPTQATTINNYYIDLLCVRDGHTATVTTNRLDDDALRAAAMRADEAARAARTNGLGSYPGLTEPAIPPPHDGFDAETTRLDPARAGAALADAFAVARAHDLEAFGVWTTGVVQTAIASTAGRSVVDHVTDAFMKVVCRDADGRSGYAADAAVAADALHPEQIARRAAAKITRDEPAVLSPAYVSRRARARGGRRAARDARDARLQRPRPRGGPRRVRRPARHERRAPRRSTSRTRRATRARCRARSTPRACRRRRCALIENGVARGVVHDHRSAAAEGDGGTVDRPRARAGRLAVRPVPDEPRARRRRPPPDVAELARADRARDLRHAAVVPQPRAREGDARSPASPATARSSSRTARSRGRCATCASPTPSCGC